MKRRKKVFIGVSVIVAVLIVGMFIPQQATMPVKGASKNDYHPQSFWFSPWGASGTHKGVDIFAKRGTEVLSATRGIVLYSGTVGMGGKVVVILGPKWRVHYYAHIDTLRTTPFTIVHNTSVIGTVGSTGNAAGKPPHLHYAIVTLIPYLWRIDDDLQGWKKMFFLNPISYLE